MNEQTERTIPDIRSWTRVNPKDQDDVERALAMVPDEERISVADALGAFDERMVVFLQDEEVRILPEPYFEKEYLSGDETPAEDAKVQLYELIDDGDRAPLSAWLKGLDPDVDVDGIQSRVSPGDLVLRRDGAFGVYKSAKNIDWNIAGLRLQVLEVTAKMPVFTITEKNTATQRAQELYDWVTGL